RRCRPPHRAKFFASQRARFSRHRHRPLGHPGDDHRRNSRGRRLGAGADHGGRFRHPSPLRDHDSRHPPPRRRNPLQPHGAGAHPRRRLPDRHGRTGTTGNARKPCRPGRCALMKIVTAEEMREIDRLTTEKYGVPSLTLMENAGAAVAEFAQKHFAFGSVCVVCGKGNNGGDGFVAARKLKEAGKKVSVIVLAKNASELRGDAGKMFKKLGIVPLWIAAEKDFGGSKVRNALAAELIVDAVLGTGFKPPLKGLAAKAIEVMNGQEGWVLAVDLPSGVDADRDDPV